MKVLIIGSGLIGVTTAFFLKRRGYNVTVLDRAPGPGRETSFANGALLTPSMSDPWNSPGCWRVLLASLGGSDAALQLHLRELPGLAGWGIEFLKNSAVSKFTRNTLVNFRLAQHSRKVMHTLLREVNIEYGHTARGTLKVFRQAAAFDQASVVAHRLSSEGLSFRTLSAAETVALEPGLAPIQSQLAGAIHFDDDETGDAYRFCVALADVAKREGVEFCFDTEASSLETRLGRVTAVVSGKQRFVADHYVVAAGSYSTRLLRRVGIRLPVRPAKGYSITMPHEPNKKYLDIPVVDDLLHAVVVPLEGAIRVAGTAEFAGFDYALTPARIQNLQSMLGEILPEAHFDPNLAKAWCGLRPMSADGVPIIGRTPLSNLFVNTGHGHLGWTMTAGSAQLFADLISGDHPAIDPMPYALARFVSASPTLSHSYRMGAGRCWF